MRTLEVGDLFCGAGGSSEGLRQACAEIGAVYQLTAVNHWDVAIASHTANHPEANHLCAEVDKLRSRALAPSGRLDILWASPSCTEHSYAKGGHSVDDQNRVSAWAIVREVERYRPSVVIVENVPPFRNWGPTEPVFNDDGTPKRDKNGDQMMRPIKARKGETFRAWFAALESLGYSGKWDLLNAADFGEPQTRIRFFAIFTATGVHMQMPEPTHGKPGTLEVARGIRAPWVAARQIIDWTIASESIFERARPLSPNTMRRIEAGIRKYCSGALAEAFLVVLRNHADAQDLADPAQTITAGGLHVGLAETTCTPFVVGQQTNAAARSVDEPLPTVATGGKIRVCEADAFVLGQHGGGIARCVGEPLSTVTKDGYVRVFEPIVVDVRHGDRPHAPKSTDEPLGTVTGKNGIGVVEPFIVPQQGDGPADVAAPLSTVTTTSRGVRLVEPFVVSYAERDGAGSGKNAVPPKSVDEPLGTVITRDRFGIAEPFVASYYGDKGGEARTRSIDEPIPTVPTENRFGVVEPSVEEADVEPFLYGGHIGGAAQSLDQPVPTITARTPAPRLVQPSVAPAGDRKRGRLVEIDGKMYVLDIRFRMLQPLELGRAQGFPDDYVFTGTKEARTAQIGNAVPVGVAKALIREALIALGYGAQEDVA